MNPEAHASLKRQKAAPVLNKISDGISISQSRKSASYPQLVKKWIKDVWKSLGISEICDRIDNCLEDLPGGLAQLVEHLHHTQGVAGSSPVLSTKLKP